MFLNEALGREKEGEFEVEMGKGYEKEVEWAENKKSAHDPKLHPYKTQLSPIKEHKSLKKPKNPKAKATTSHSQRHPIRLSSP